MSKILYTIGDSYVYRGPQYTTWSSMLSKKINYIDANNGMSGTSNDRTFRSVIRDITRIETEGKLWTENTNDIDCDLEELFVIIGWTSPTRFEWFKNGEYVSSRYWETSNFIRGGNKSLDFSFSDEITLPLTEQVNSYIRFFNQIITLKIFLESKSIKNIFYNTFYPFGENTIDYFEKTLDELEDTKPKKLLGYDNPPTYYSLKSLWKKVPQDYKINNQLEQVTDKNLDETLHPTPKGDEIWSEYLTKQVKKLNE